MTEHTEEEKGIAQVLLKRLVDQRLPRLLEMQERVNSGQLLNDFDIEYLEEAFHDASQNRQHVEHYPEYHDIAARLTKLYEEITAQALKNQQTQKSNPTATHPR